MQRFSSFLMRTAALALVPLLLAGSIKPASAAAGDLVIGGERIADAATYAAAKREGKLILYSTYILSSMKAVTAKFKADTGIDVEIVRLITPLMYDRVLSEYGTKKLAADYVDLTDITLVNQLAQKGILAPYKVTSFGELDPTLRDSNGKWYSLMRSLMGVGVNTAVIAPGDVPKKWTDLLEPKYKGKLGFMAIDSGGTGFALAFFQHQKFGSAYWKKLAEQQPRTYLSGSPLDADLARGQFGIGIAPVDGLLDDVRSGAPVKIITLAEGIPAYATTGGMTTTGAHPHAAQVFLDWMTSKHGGETIQANGAYGPRKDTAAPVVEGVTFPAAAQLYNVRPSDVISSRDALTKEWHSIFGTK
ncbi:MAG TPA: ABC transporter substrate-binding protein [Candidatus Lustribacter sp.]